MRIPQITIDMMVAVIALADERTFEKAADEIGVITASAVHKRVQTASRLFGAPLFVNSVEGMTLTSAGEAFYTGAVRAVEQTLLAEERVAARLSLEAQHLRIGHSTYLSPRSLGAVLRLRLGGKPPIQIEHTSGLTNDLARRVEEGELHAGFGYLPVNRPDLLTRVLWEEPLEVFMAASHPLAVQPGIRPTDLQDEPLIAVGRAALPWFHEEIDEYFSGFGVRLRVVADAMGPPEALIMTEQKVGVCLLGASAASRPGVISKSLTPRILTRKSGIFVREDNRHPAVRSLLEIALEMGSSRTTNHYPSSMKK
jgi:LysR family transcriptional regulator, benzoate and cis,cis-muconate-responsive activator of ben and cat genes